MGTFIENKAFTLEMIVFTNIQLIVDTEKWPGLFGEFVNNFCWMYEKILRCIFSLAHLNRRTKLLMTLLKCFVLEHNVFSTKHLRSSNAIG